MRPHRARGQNFLADDRIVQRIIAAAELGPGDVVLEVGPGLGVLTRELADRVSLVVAVEVDRGLVEALKHVLAGYENVELINADILDVDPAVVVHGRPYKVVANLPYSITSLALRHFLEARHRPSRMVVMVQKEVARRIVAKPGELSLLAISVQVYGRPRLVTEVPASAFVPPPKVDSAVVVIDLHERPTVNAPLDKFFRVVHGGFAQPRKQLHNALARTLWLPKDSAPDILRAVGVDPMRRAQTLSLDEWERLTAELMGRGLV
ncbi:MAG: ribosomal RNA small subunit methyltransferase A [Chloroflexi bacterium]|nr:ribosomal RNA small subunit methyltransferase A [Chloroflexota bacterium]